MIFSDDKPSVKCPYCKDTGWILYRKWVEDVGYEAEFARPCDRCNIHKRTPDNRTGVPEEFVQKGMSSFDVNAYSKPDRALMARNAATSLIQNFDEWQRQRVWLYLWSKTPGSGKTMLACIIANHLRGKHSIRFVTAPEYIRIVGDSYKRETGATDQSAQYRECELLILDDLGAQKKGEWQDEELFKLIDGRLRHNLITVITSNSMPRQLNLSERTINRLESCCLEVSMPEESIRKKASRKKMDDFQIKVIDTGR